MESIEQTGRRFPRVQVRMRALLLLILLTAVATHVSAQTFAEWFEQNKTQKKYLLQQIAALQAFSECLKQGYQTASEGLGSISGSLTAENSLHATYYNRLKTADPMVRNNSLVKDIMTWQQDILAQLTQISQLTGLSYDETSYFGSVRSAVLKDCNDQISILQKVITDGKLEMSDAERMSLIARIHAAMMSNYRFASGFTAQAEVYVSRRRQEQQGTVTEKQLYGIN